MDPSYELDPIVDELVYLLPQFLNPNETVCQGNVFCRQCNPESLIKPCSKDVLDCHCFLIDSCSKCGPDLPFPASDPLPRLDRPISQPGVGSAGIDVHEAARSHVVYMSVPYKEDESVAIGTPVSRFQYSKLPPIPRYLQGSLRVPQYDLTTDNTQPHCTNSDRPFLIAPLLTEDLDLWFYSELGDQIFRRVMENSLQYDRTYVKLSRLAEDDNIDEGIYQTLDFNDWIKFSRLCYRVASDVSSQSSLPDSDEFTTTFQKGERIKPSFGSSNHALRQRYGLQNDWASMKMGDSEIIIHGGLLKQRHLGSRIELAKLAQLCTTRWFFQGVDSTRTRLCNAISAYKKQICEAGAAGTSNIVDYVSAIGLDKAGILGKGVCGSVIEGKHGITAFAVKTVDLKGRDDPFSIIDSEMNPVRWSHIKSQSRMRHRYSQPIGLISAWIDVNKERLYLLTPREDTLTDFIALWNRRLTNANLIEKSCYRLICASIMHQIFEQLRFMHGRGITHGDIYPRNIVLNLVTLEPEIIDFSSSQTVNDDVLTASDGECSTVDESELSPAVWSGTSSIQDEAFDVKVARHIYEALLPGLTDANSQKVAGAFTRDDVREEHALTLKLGNRSIKSETVLKELSGIISHITGNMTSNDDGIKQLRALPFQFRQKIGFQYHSTNISWRAVVIDPPIRQIREVASILNMTDGNIRLAFYLSCLLEMVFSLHTSPSSNFYFCCLGLEILSTLKEVISIATGWKSFMQTFHKLLFDRLLEPISRTTRIVISSKQHLLQNMTATGPGGMISPTIRRRLDTSLFSRSCGQTGDSRLPERIQKCALCLTQHISACVVTITLLLSALLVWLPRFSPSWSTTLLISDMMIEALSNDDDSLHQAFFYQHATNYLCMLLRPYSHVFSWYLEFSFVLHQLALAAVWITAIDSVVIRSLVLVTKPSAGFVFGLIHSALAVCNLIILAISTTLFHISAATGKTLVNKLAWATFVIAICGQYFGLVSWPSVVSTPVTIAFSLNLLYSIMTVPE